MRHPVTRFFVFCSGQASEILVDCPPTETTKAVGVGTAVLFTGLFACVAGTYALSRVFGTGASEMPAVLGLGLAWGLFVFALDRFIVSSMRKDDSLLREIVHVTPRIILATLISILITKPLEIGLFQDRVARQLHQMRLDALAHDTTLIQVQEGLPVLSSEVAGHRTKMSDIAAALARDPETPYFLSALERETACRTELADRETRAAQEQSSIARSRAKVDADLALARRGRRDARQRRDQASKDLRALRLRSGAPVAEGQRAALEAIVSSSDADLAGLERSVAEGEVQQSALNRRSEAIRSEVAEKRASCSELAATVDQARQDHRSSLSDEMNLEKSLHASATADEMTVKAKVDGRIAEASATIGRAFGDNFIGEVEAFGLMTSVPFSTLWWSHWLLAALFFVVETAPIAVKLMSRKGPYDFALEASEAASEALSTAEIELFRSAANPLRDLAGASVAFERHAASLGAQTSASVRLVARLQEEFLKAEALTRDFLTRAPKRDESQRLASDGLLTVTSVARSALDEMRSRVGTDAASTSRRPASPADN